MKFAGKKDQDGAYAWLNPDLPHAQRYDPTRLLSEFVEVDEATYDYFLGQMPPLSNPYGFAICEEVTQGIHLSFFRIDGRYFACHVQDRRYCSAAGIIRRAIA